MSQPVRDVNKCIVQYINLYKGADNWSNMISIILNSIHCMHVYRNKTWCDIKDIENRLIDNYVTKWKSTIEKKRLN